MKATQQLHDLGQSLRLDNITRGLASSRWRKLTGGGASGAYVYSAAVSASRPPEDYAARMIPHCGGIAIPLEDARILWQR
jgi:hypothetical protein